MLKGDWYVVKQGNGDEHNLVVGVSSFSYQIVMHQTAEMDELQLQGLARRI